MTATHITHKGTHKGSFAGLLFGGLVGAGVALIAAPWSGKETRQRIGGFAEDVKGRAECYAYRAKGRVTSVVERGRDLVEQKKSLVVKAIEAGREAYTKETQRLLGRHECEAHEKGAGTF